MPKKIQLLLKKLYPNSQLPIRKIEDDAGWDCFIHHFVQWNEPDQKLIPFKNDTYPLQPHETIGCALGFASAIPTGYYGHLLPRSGLALKQNLVTVIGTIDAGYRNEWVAIVNNLGVKPVEIKCGERICQLVIRKIVDIELMVTDALPDSVRGLNGLGSSGK